MKLYAYESDGKLIEVSKEQWSIKTESGETPTELSANELYEVHVTVDDGGTADLSENEKEIKLSVVLGK